MTGPVSEPDQFDGSTVLYLPSRPAGARIVATRDVLPDLKTACRVRLAGSERTSSGGVIGVGIVAIQIRDQIRRLHDQYRGFLSSENLHPASIYVRSAIMNIMPACVLHAASSRSLFSASGPSPIQVRGKSRPPKVSQVGSSAVGINFIDRFNQERSQIIAVGTKSCNAP